MSVWDKIASTTSEMNPISFKEKKKSAIAAKNF